MSKNRFNFGSGLIIPRDTAVVIERGKYAGEPAVVVNEKPETIEVLLSRTGERVTVRKTSVEVYL